MMTHTPHMTSIPSWNAPMRLRSISAAMSTCGRPENPELSSDTKFPPLSLVSGGAGALVLHCLAARYCPGECREDNAAAFAEANGNKVTVSRPGTQDHLVAVLQKAA